MISSKRFILSALLLSTLLLGCVPLSGMKTSPDHSQRQLSPNEFTPQIEQLLKQSASVGEKDKTRAAEIHYEIARLFLDPRNPNQDFDKAAAQLEKYLETDGHGSNGDDAKNLLAVLKEVNECKQNLNELQSQLKKERTSSETSQQKDTLINKLSRENDLLLKSQKELLAENNKLMATIEKLKFLDLNLEKKRKTFR